MVKETLLGKQLIEIGNVRISFLRILLHVDKHTEEKKWKSSFEKLLVM